MQLENGTDFLTQLLEMGPAITVDKNGGLFLMFGGSSRNSRFTKWE